MCLSREVVGGRFGWILGRDPNPLYGLPDSTEEDAEGGEGGEPVASSSVRTLQKYFFDEHHEFHRCSQINQVARVVHK